MVVCTNIEVMEMHLVYMRHCASSLRGLLSRTPRLEQSERQDELYFVICNYFNSLVVSVFKQSENVTIAYYTYSYMYIVSIVWLAVASLRGVACALLGSKCILHMCIRDNGYI